MARVAHLTSVHPPFDTRIFHKECKTLVEAGYEVVLIVPHDRDETREHVRIRAVPKPKGRLERVTRMVLQVYRAALDESAEVYHLHDPELVPIGLLLKMRGKTVVYDVHEDYATAVEHKGYLPRLFRPLAAAYFRKAEPLLVAPFQVVLAEKYYARRFPDGITVLNYPVTEHFAVSGTARRGHPPRLLYTGVVSPCRGALQHAQIVSLMDDVEVYAVGRCSEDLACRMRQVAGRGRDRLRIEGEGTVVPYGRMLEYYARGGWSAGLAIFPPSPHYVEKELTKFFEYMGAGIPVICSDFPAWRSLVEKTGSGLCVDPLDPTAVVAAIRFLTSHPEEAEKMGQNGRRAFLDRYNWDTEAKKLVELYKTFEPKAQRV